MDSRNRIIEIIGQRSNQGQRQEVLHSLVHFDNRAQLLTELVKIWSSQSILSDGMVAAHAYGAGGGGGSRVAPTPAFDLVTRAAEVVEAIWQEAENRGWILIVPSWERDQC